MQAYLDGTQHCRQRAGLSGRMKCPRSAVRWLKMRPRIRIGWARGPPGRQILAVRSSPAHEDLISTSPYHFEAGTPAPRTVASAVEHVLVLLGEKVYLSLTAI